MQRMRLMISSRKLPFYLSWILSMLQSKPCSVVIGASTVHTVWSRNRKYQVLWIPLERFQLVDYHGVLFWRFLFWLSKQRSEAGVWVVPFGDLCIALLAFLIRWKLVTSEKNILQSYWGNYYEDLTICIQRGNYIEVRLRFVNWGNMIYQHREPLCLIRLSRNTLQILKVKSREFKDRASQGTRWIDNSTS
jgi:hypothetical protein